MPNALATKYNLSVLAAYPLDLEHPSPADVGPGPNHLNCIFTGPKYTAIISTYSTPACHSPHRLAAEIEPIENSMLSFSAIAYDYTVAAFEVDALLA
jgi:hypothetical protein